MGGLFRNTKCCVIIMLDTQLTLVYNLRNSKFIWQLPDFEVKINHHGRGGTATMSASQGVPKHLRLASQQVAVKQVRISGVDRVPG